MIGAKNDPRFGMAREGEGAMRWCKRCSRVHLSQASCNIIRVTRIGKSGKRTTRLAHIRRSKDAN